MVLISEIKPPVVDMRTSMDEAKFQELCQSIKEIGVQEPIKISPCKDGEYEIVFGVRRVKASISLGLPKIPAVIEKMAPEKILLARAVENLQREDVSPIDQARYVEKIMTTFNLNQVEVSKMIGLSDGRVSQLLTILRKDPVIRDMVEAGDIPEAVGRELLRHPNEVIRHDFARFAARDGWNQQATRRYVEENTAIMQGRPIPTPSEDYQPEGPPIPVVIPKYPCRLCGNQVPIETMPIFRTCPECMTILETAIEKGVFLYESDSAAKTANGPGDRGIGADTEAADAN